MQLFGVPPARGRLCRCRRRKHPMKFIKQLALSVSMSAVMATAAAAQSGLEGMTIGFSQIGSESGWRAAETSVTRQQAEEWGVNLQFSDAQQRQENQIRAIRSFVAQGVDAILLAPVVATGW